MASSRRYSQSRWLRCQFIDITCRALARRLARREMYHERLARLSEEFVFEPGLLEPGLRPRPKEQKSYARLSRSGQERVGYQG